MTNNSAKPKDRPAKPPVRSLSFPSHGSVISLSHLPNRHNAHVDEKKHGKKHVNLPAADAATALLLLVRRKAVHGPGFAEERSVPESEAECKHPEFELKEKLNFVISDNRWSNNP